MKFIGISSPCWTFKNKNQTNFAKPKKKIVSKNGPGSYSLKNTCKLKYKNPPKWKFGKNTRFKKKEKNENDELSKRSLENYLDMKNKNYEYRLTNILNSRNVKKNSTFGNSKRKNLSIGNLKNPGPGAYDSVNNFKIKKIKECKFASRSYKNSNNEKTEIGPAKYYVANKNWKNGRKIYFNKIKKIFKNQKNCQNKKNLDSKKSKKSNSYKIPKKLKRENKTFGQDKKDSKIPNSENPGPGAYKNVFSKSLSNFKTKTTGFGKIPKKKKNKFSNTNYKFYNLKSSLSKKGFQFGKVGRFKKKQKNKNFEISQKNINNKYEKNFENNKGFSFGFQIKNSFEKNENPGPGFYETKNIFNSKKIKDENIIFKNSWFNIVKHDGIPGPGQYNSKIDFKYKKSENWSFGKNAKNKENLKTENLENNENRDYYDIRWDLEKKGFIFDKNRRFSDKIVKKHLGPGYYKILSTIPQNQPWVQKEFQEKEDLFENFDY